LLETIASHEKICSYLDVPLQHGSPSALKRMKRGGGAEIFLKGIARMRREIPNVTLRTSFIVGFPGETESEFQQLCDFVRSAEFDWMGVFSYSDEDGAGAFKLGNKVSPRKIESRRKKLMKLQQTISRRKKKELVGQHFELLVEGPSQETDLLWEGRTALHAPEIDGKVFINDFGPHQELTRGEFYKCEISEAHDYDLVARII
jgi:ribosomal protein S12 methylthiotransferase